MQRKRLLRTAFVALVALAVGKSPVSAFTTNELEGQGWTKVTNLTDVSNYYYVFVDAGSSNYAMGRLASSADKPVYMNLADPLGFAGVVWALSGSGSYTMQNLIDNRYFISGDAGWNDSMADAAGSQGSFSISLADGKYSIKSATTNSWVGPWNNDGAVANNYENIAANKSEAQAPGFFIYAMSRTDYNSKRITDSWLTSHGWSKVTANSALGNTANYYLIVEKESFGYALARTSSGRPVHKSLSNPFAAPNELWLLSASGSGYKFQSAVDGTYFTSAAGDWNTSMSSTANADIIATVSDGVYTLSAGGSNNIGHWQDNTQYPFENENVAANKNATNRNSYYIYTISKSDYATQRASVISSLASTATEASPANLTSFVVNNSDFSILAKQGWTTSGTADNQQTANGAFETWNSNNVSITQEVADLPGGLYTFKAQMVMGNNTTTANLYANADQEYTASASQVCTSASYNGMKAELMADPAYAQVTVNPHMSSNGTMTVGLKVPSGWIVFDNFQLLYQGPTIKSNSTAFTSGSAVTADQWYAFDIPVAGDYAFTTTDALNNISYTTEGMTLVEHIGSLSMGTPSATTSLSAGTIYFKSSNAATITIAPQSYTYTVGSATVDYEYVQGGETVTVTYADAVTNSGEALAVSTSGVTFNGSTPAELTATANGFTFKVPSGLTAATSYTLAIPAGIIGYADGNTFNEAQSITFKTPAVLDGTYYLKVAATTTDRTTNSTATGTVGKYLARGTSYGTHATVDNYGLAINVTTDKDNFTTLQVYDTKRYYFTTGSYDVYADGTGGTAANQKFVITTNQGKLLIAGQATPNVFFKHNNGDANNASASVFYDGNGTNSGPIILWEVETPTEHQTIMTARKNAQAGTAAAAAFDGDADTYASLSSVTTKDALESAVASMYSKVVSPVVTTTGIQEKYQGDQPGQGNTMETVYSAELTIPAQGLYKFSMQAFYRAASNGVTQDMHTNNVDCPPVFLFLGDYETQIKSLYDETGLQQSEYENETVGGAPVEYNGTYYTNGQHNSEIVLSKGLYNNDVWAYFPAAGTYTYGVKYTGFANANMQWFIYYPQSVSVTYYGSDDSRFDKLNAEIAKAQAINGVWNNSDLADEITTAQAMYTAYTANLTAVNNEIDALKAKYPTSVAVNNGNFDTNPVLLADGTTASGANQVVSTNGTLYDVTGFSSSESGSEWVYGLNAEYGSTGTLNNVTPPATDIYGEASGAALGLSAGWSHNAVYSQDVTIANAGRYLIYYEAFNKNSVATISGNKIGLDGTYSDKVNGFTENQWVRDLFVVDIYEAGTYPLTVGIYGEGGSGSNAKLWVDNVEIYRVGDAEGSIQTADGIVTVLGGNALDDINAALTNTISVLNLEKATGLSSATISTATNPNLLIYAKNGSQVSNTKNVIVSGTCSTLELQKSSTNFIVPTAFTATNAKYIVANGDLAGGNFATLMLPFAAALPSGGAAYTLDQGVDLIDGNIRGTSASSIAANSPVLVTKAGDYTATNAAIPTIASGANYTNGELVGTYSAVAAPTNSYVLQNHTNGEGVAFYLVGNTQPTVNPFRAYIQAQASNVKAIHVEFGEDGIDEIANDILSSGHWYNLEGQRLSKPAKGVNIIRGKKVIIK